MTVPDVCVIGSGAGGAPLAALLAEAGQSVVVLEKGAWFEEADFVKDEIGVVRRPVFLPRTRDEPMEQETRGSAQAGSGVGTRTGTFWNGSLVGGSSVLMSGFMMRLKPHDFRQRSTFGPIPGADTADWPLSYDEFEPWYSCAEREVGVSGRTVPLPAHLDERRSAPLPQPPLREHPFASHIDRTCKSMGLTSVPLPRAVLSQDMASPGKVRKACDYNGYCGSYGCATGAKGSALAAFIHRAVATGRCDIRSRSRAVRLESDATGAVRRVRYLDAAGREHLLEAERFIVACQAIESARLLLLSRGPRHPHGLGNHRGLVGKNLLFCSFGAGWGDFALDGPGGSLRSNEPFTNRIVQDFYYYDPRDPRRNAGQSEVAPGPGMMKAGTLNFLPVHPNPALAAIMQSLWDERPGGVPLWGEPLKERLRWYFHDVAHLRFETFSEWLPHKDSRMQLAPTLKDKWGIPAAKIRAFNHRRSLAAVRFLVQQGKRVLETMGARTVRMPPSFGGPSTNLIAGTCRFGDDPTTSVLDRHCKVHGTPNVYVTDASFMPSGGSVPYTLTIYANALRVAEHIKSIS